jgi:hypothetical protein
LSIWPYTQKPNGTLIYLKKQYINLLVSISAPKDESCPQTNLEPFIIDLTLV